MRTMMRLEVAHRRPVTSIEALTGGIAVGFTTGVFESPTAADAPGSLQIGRKGFFQLGELVVEFLSHLLQIVVYGAHGCTSSLRAILVHTMWDILRLSATGGHGQRTYTISAIQTVGSPEDSDPCRSAQIRVPRIADQSSSFRGDGRSSPPVPALTDAVTFSRRGPMPGGRTAEPPSADRSALHRHLQDPWPAMSEWH